MSSIPRDVVQTMSLHHDPAVKKLVDKHWGKIRATPAEKQEQIKRLQSLIKSGGGEPDRRPRRSSRRTAASATRCSAKGARPGPT